MVLIDSSVWIEGLRRNGDLKVKVGLQGLLDEYEALLCGLVRLEVLGGARQGERRKIEGHFQCLPYRPMVEKNWDHAKENAWRLRDNGITVPWSDIVIATLSILWNVRVYSVDQHFEMMREVMGIRLYEPGYGGAYSPG